MKQKLNFKSILICLFYSIFLLLNISNIKAQSPLAIPYQAVARNSSGNIIANQTVSLRFSIHDITISGTIVYRETQSVGTNTLGLFTVNIGQGVPLIGTIAGINWSNGTKFIQVELDVLGGTSFIDMGTTQLLSVPYALYSSSSGDNRWGLNSNNIYNLNSGNIGIGVTTPTAKLHIKNQALNSTGIRLESYTGNTPLFTVLQGGSGNGNMSLFDSAGVENFKIATSLTANSWINCANVGIGTSNPTSKLEVNGSIKNYGEITSVSQNSFRTVFGAYGSFIRNDGSDTYFMLTNPNDQYGTYSNPRPFRINHSNAFVEIATGAIHANDGGNVGIGTALPAASAKLDISSTTQGFLPPRMTIAQRNAIPNPEMGLIICCTNCSAVPEIEMYNGTNWTSLKGVTAGATIFSDTAVICGQVWMKKNLNVDKYRNGDPIPRVSDLSSAIGGAYTYYANDSASYAATYGKLYNSAAINDPRGLAPIGWHIPTSVEWTWLENCVGGASGAGHYLKESGNTHWDWYSLIYPSNSSGFTALPGGKEGGTLYATAGQFAYFWVKTTSGTSVRQLSYNSNAVVTPLLGTTGASVRCLQD